MSFIFSSHWIGRFGNRMHQYAYGMTYAKLNDASYILPSEWEGCKLFKNPNSNILEKDLQEKLNEFKDERCESEVRKQIVREFYPDVKFIDPTNELENYSLHETPVCFDNICAYSQTVFSKMSKKHLLEIFEFSDEVKNTQTYKYWSSKAGTYNIAHLRRDDIADPEYNKTHEQAYSVISKRSYTDAMYYHGFNPNDFEWTSDDYLREWHKDRKETIRLGWNYPEGSEYRQDIIFDWLEDFLRIYFAKNIFRANSSFSWWASFLSPTATVYSPVLDKQVIYGINSYKEIDVNFVKGNHPHWMYNVKDITINE